MNASKEKCFEDYPELVRSSNYGPKTVKLYEFLTSRVIGQERAANRLARSFAVYNAGLKSPRKPINAVIFSGPTGVGKTMMAGEMAKFLIADMVKPPMISVDCQMYTEHHQISQLLGSPPGYVGFENLPVLSQSNIDSFHFWIKFNEMIRNMDSSEFPNRGSREWDIFAAEMYRKLSPYISVILFDEIEKAHKAIPNVLLGIIDKAEAAMANPSFGTTDFSNSVIVLTCNIGGRAASELLSGRKRSVSFQGKSVKRESEDSIDQVIYEQTLSMIQRSGFFPAEFVGRIRDQIVVFRAISRDDSRKVLENMLAEVQKSIVVMLDNNNKKSADGTNRQLSIELNYSDEFKEFLLDKGVSMEYGLRPLEQAVKQYITLELANALEAGEIRPGDKVMFNFRSGRREIRRRCRNQSIVRSSGFDFTNLPPLPLASDPDNSAPPSRPTKKPFPPPPSSPQPPQPPPESTDPPEEE